MAKDLRGLSVGNIGSTLQSVQTTPLLLSQDVRGGLSEYNDSERNFIPGERLANNMIIWNTDSEEYQMYAGGTRNASGVLSGGLWRTLYLPVDTEAVGPAQIDAENPMNANTVLHLDTDASGNFFLSWRAASTQSIGAGSITSDLLNQNVAGFGLLKPSMTSGLEVDTEIIADTEFVKIYVANATASNIGLFSTTQDGLAPKTTDSENDFRHYLRGDRRWARQEVTGDGVDSEIILIHNTVTAGIKASGRMEFSGSSSSFNGLVIAIRQPDRSYESTDPLATTSSGDSDNLVGLLALQNSFQGFLSNLTGIRNVRYRSLEGAITWDYTTPGSIDTDTDIVIISGITGITVSSFLTEQGVFPEDTEFAHTNIPIDTNYMATRTFARTPFQGPSNTPPSEIRFVFSGNVTTPFSVTTPGTFNFYPNATDDNAQAIPKVAATLTTAEDVRNFIYESYRTTNPINHIGTMDTEGTDTIVLTATPGVNRDFTSRQTDFGIDGITNDSDTADLTGISMMVTSSSFSNVLGAVGDSDSSGASLIARDSELLNLSPFNIGLIANGVAGAVPAPDSDQGNLFLRGDGTWQVVSLDDSDTMYRAGYGLLDSDNIFSVDTDTIASTDYASYNIALDTDGGIGLDNQPVKRLGFYQGSHTEGEGSRTGLIDIINTGGLEFTQPLNNRIGIGVNTGIIADRDYVDSHSGVLDTELSAGYGIIVQADSDRHTINVDTDTIASRNYVDTHAGVIDTDLSAGYGIILRETGGKHTISVDTDHPDGVASRSFVINNFEERVFDTDVNGLVPSPSQDEVTHRYHLSADGEWRSLELRQAATDSEKIISLNTRSSGRRAQVRVDITGSGNIGGVIRFVLPNGDTEQTILLSSPNNTQPADFIFLLQNNSYILNNVTGIRNVQYQVTSFTFEFSDPGEVDTDVNYVHTFGTGSIIATPTLLEQGADPSDTEYAAVAITPYTDTENRTLVGLVPAPGATRNRGDVLTVDGWGPNGRTDISTFNTILARNSDTEHTWYRGQIVQVVGDRRFRQLFNNSPIPSPDPQGVYFRRTNIGTDSELDVLFTSITREQVEEHVRPGAVFFNDLDGIFGALYTLDTVGTFDSDTYSILCRVRPGSDFTRLHELNITYLTYFNFEIQSANRGLYQYIGTDGYQGATTDSDWYFLTGNYSSPPKEDFRTISDRNNTAIIRWKIGDFVSVGEEVYVYSGPEEVKGLQQINSDQLEPGPTSSLEWTQIGFTGLKGDTIQDIRYYNEQDLSDTRYRTDAVNSALPLPHGSIMISDSIIPFFQAADNLSWSQIRTIRLAPRDEDSELYRAINAAGAGSIFTVESEDGVNYASWELAGRVASPFARINNTSFLVSNLRGNSRGTYRRNIRYKVILLPVEPPIAAESILGEGLVSQASHIAGDGTRIPFTARPVGSHTIDTNRLSAANGLVSAIRTVPIMPPPAGYLRTNGLSPFTSLFTFSTGGITLAPNQWAFVNDTNGNLNLTPTNWNWVTNPGPTRIAMIMRSDNLDLDTSVANIGVLNWARSGAAEYRVTITGTQSGSAIPGVIQLPSTLLPRALGGVVNIGSGGAVGGVGFTGREYAVSFYNSVITNSVDTMGYTLTLDTDLADSDQGSIIFTSNTNQFVSTVDTDGNNRFSAILAGGLSGTLSVLSTGNDFDRRMVAYRDADNWAVYNLAGIDVDPRTFTDGGPRQLNIRVASVVAQSGRPRIQVTDVNQPTEFIFGTPDQYVGSTEYPVIENFGLSGNESDTERSTYFLSATGNWMTVNSSSANSDSDIESISNSISSNQLTTTLTTEGGRTIPSAPVSLGSAVGVSQAILDSEIDRLGLEITGEDENHIHVSLISHNTVLRQGHPGTPARYRVLFFGNNTSLVINNQYMTIPFHDTEVTFGPASLAQDAVVNANYLDSELRTRPDLVDTDSISNSNGYVTWTAAEVGYVGGLFNLGNQLAISRSTGFISRGSDSDATIYSREVLGGVDLPNVDSELSRTGLRETRHPNYVRLDVETHSTVLADGHPGQGAIATFTLDSEDILVGTETYVFNLADTEFTATVTNPATNLAAITEIATQMFDRTGTQPGDLFSDVDVQNNTITYTENSLLRNDSDTPLNVAESRIGWGLTENRFLSRGITFEAHRETSRIARGTDIQVFDTDAGVVPGATPTDIRDRRLLAADGTWYDIHDTLDTEFTSIREAVAVEHDYARTHIGGIPFDTETSVSPRQFSSVVIDSEQTTFTILPQDSDTWSSFINGQGQRLISTQDNSLRLQMTLRNNADDGFDNRDLFMVGVDSFAFNDTTNTVTVTYNNGDAILEGRGQDQFGQRVTSRTSYTNGGYFVGIVGYIGTVNSPIFYITDLGSFGEDAYEWTPVEPNSLFITDDRTPNHFVRQADTTVVDNALARGAIKTFSPTLTFATLDLVLPDRRIEWDNQTLVSVEGVDNFFI